jgi:diacylglycerol kinase family enzyme
VHDLPITVVMNASSGSQDKLASRQAIEEVLNASGRDTRVLVARRPRDVATLAQQAATARGGVLAAAGGDGTLNAVAAVAHAARLPFGLIPLGTFNYFARQLKIPLEPEQATRALIEGHVRPVVVGQVNGRLFLNNASIGLYRKLIERRELDKRRFGRNRFVALLSGLVFLLRGHPSFRLSLEIDGRHSTLSTLSVFFGCNTLQMEQLGLDEAECVARGELAVLALRDVSRFEVLALVLRGAFARLETAENLRQHCAMKVRIDRLDGRVRRIRVAIDGESVECDLPLHFESVSDPLQVVVPAIPEEAG